MKYVFIVESRLRDAKHPTRTSIGVGKVSSAKLFDALTKAMEKEGYKVTQVDDPGDEERK